MFRVESERNRTTRLCLVAHVGHVSHFAASLVRSHIFFWLVWIAAVRLAGDVADMICIVNNLRSTFVFTLVQS